MSASATPIHLPRSPAAGRVTQRRVALSEWTKLRSLRSTVYTLLAGALVTIGFGVLASAITASRWATMSAADKADFNPLTTSLVGVNFGVLAIGVLGVLLITGEYTTGMVRSTFAAVPKRLPVLWAKVGVYSLVGLAVTVPSALIAFFAGQSFLSSKHIDIAFSHSGVPGAVLGSALYLTLAGLLGLGLGAILRNTAAGIATFAAIMFVIPPLVSILPASTANAIDPYLPSNAGSAIMKLGHQAHSLSPWVGLAVFAGYAALTIAVAAVRLRRRDV
ncbi:MAG: type transport system permease protein [Solirubrobacteraceae bacterium]|jgi:ABC-type transport system involved in multi-copper enzyme maturation permease subunit|nr:type transport system permease protein [Solirubrobacteraceae bacterium]